jgi:HAD superfamily hydrolase (TIGR01484 family)
MPFGLLAIDVDGTLLNSRNELSKTNRDALHQAHEAGLVICICTGRNLVETRSVIEQIGLDLNAGVFVFGAIVADLANHQVLFRNPMPAETADRLVRHLGGNGHHVLVLYDRVEAGCDYVLVEGRHEKDAYERWLALTPARAERIREWQPRSCSPLRVGIIEQPGRIEHTLRDLQAAFPADQAKINSIYAPNYGLHVVECFGPAVNKWHGITQLAGRLGIAPSDIAAVGDDINDLEMISSAGFGVAMGNAIPAIKAAAAWETATNDRDGVAVLIRRLLNGEA